MFEKSLRDKNRKKYAIDDDFYSLTGHDVWYFTRELGTDLVALPMEKFLERWDKKEFWRIPDASTGFVITEDTLPSFDTWLTDDGQRFVADVEAVLRTELSRRGLRMTGLHVCSQDFSAYITDGKNWELFHWKTPSLRNVFNFTLGGADTGVIWRPVVNEKDIWGKEPHSRWNYSSFAEFPDKIKADFDRGAPSFGYSQYDTVCIAPHYLDINGSDARKVSVQERTENFLTWRRGQKYTHSQEFRNIYSRPDATVDAIAAGFEKFPEETKETFYNDAAKQWDEIYGAQYGPLDKLWVQSHGGRGDNDPSQEEGEER
jgi:hypothetical protein